jgi:hypothetical protein
MPMLGGDYSRHVFPATTNFMHDVDTLKEVAIFDELSPEALRALMARASSMVSFVFVRLRA